LSDGERPGKADLHVHTAVGDGMASPQEVLDYVEAGTDLDIIAITDHDDLEGAMQTREAWTRGSYRFQVVPGVEVTAIEGHILALFVEEPLPSLKPAEEVLAAVHRQGGLAIAAHPLSWLTRSLGRRALERIAASDAEGVYLDGLETANQSPGARVGLKKAAALNRERYHLAEVGGSDAHFLKVIGSAHTEFPGRDSEALRRSILERSCRGVSGRHPSMLEIGPLQILRQTWRGLLVTPRTMGWGATAGSFVRRIFSLR
jgi:predicted metal-dependent phosphoesterase TrpH